MEIFEKSGIAADFIESQFGSTSDLCIVTGSGLTNIIKPFTILERISFGDVPHLKASTFHKGEFLLCQYKGKSFIVLNGRLHYYEGFTADEVVFPVRILSRLGIKEMILTNASGGLNPKYKAGQIVLISDHINLMPEHPLRGPNDERIGPRFPDMSDAYSSKLRDTLKSIAQSMEMELLEGVYAGFQGPSLETPAEYKFLNIIGADMVGMSTVLETIAANHCGISVGAISVTTNLCYPPEIVSPTTLEDVVNTANLAAPKIAALLAKHIELR